MIYGSLGTTAGFAQNKTGFVSEEFGILFYDTEETAEYGDKLITLSTCEYSNKNGRLVVVAKRITDVLEE